MPLPSLYNVGALLEQKSMTKIEKQKAKSMRALDYIMDFIELRIPKRKGEYPNIRARSFGDKVILLKSGTGSGKSSAFPAELFIRFFDYSKKEIVITQPSVFNAIDVSTQITKYYSTIEFGKNIAYQTGPIKKSKREKGLTFMTVRILQNILQNADYENFAKKYSFIIIDEVHTRSKEVDTVLYLIKKFLEEMWDTPDCPIFVLASATFDKNIFMNYFNIPNKNYLEVSGMSYPIEDNFLEYSLNNYVDYAIYKIKEIHMTNIDDIKNNETMRDIIVFIFGKSIAKSIKEGIDLFNKNIYKNGYDHEKKQLESIDPRKSFEYRGGNNNYFILPIELTSTTFNKIGKEFKDLNSLIDNIDMEIYDNKLKKNIKVTPSRKLFIATPFAETGVTIETLKYCLDTGWVFGKEFNPDYNANIMKASNTTKGMSMQRRGRVGRKAPGKFYTCYTKETFDEMLEDDYSNMIKNDSSDLLLTFIIKETKAEIVVKEGKSPKKLGNEFRKFYMSDRDTYTIKLNKPFNIALMDLIEPPSGSSITLGFEKLYAFGFIDYKYNPTVLGMMADKLSRLDLESIKFILSGYAYGAYIYDLITIAAFIESGFDIKKRDYTYRNPLKLNNEQAIFYNSAIVADDFIDYLFLWYEYIELLNNIGKKLGKININKIEEWCEKNYINYPSLLNVHKTRNDYIENFIQNGFDIFKNGLNLERGDYSLVKILKNNLQEGLDEIIKIKKCLLEGFRFNLIIWDAKLNRYVIFKNNVHIKIENPLVKNLLDHSQLQQNRPATIIANSIVIKKNKISGVYEFYGGHAVSILDGFVDVDPGFLK